MTADVSSRAAAAAAGDDDSGSTWAEPQPARHASFFSRAPTHIAHDLQALTRKQRCFEELEAELAHFTAGTAEPAAASHWLQKVVSGASAHTSHLADVLSLLGPHNPLPQPVTAQDSVWLLDNVAFPTQETGETGENASGETGGGAGGGFQADYVVAVLEQHPTSRVIDAVKAVADRLGKADDDAALATIEQRIIPFLQDVLPGRQVQALHAGRWRLVFSPGGRDGLSTNTRQLPPAPLGSLVPTLAEVPAGANGMLRMETLFSAADGWGVISDIDDTIKLTQTSDPLGILQKTFVDPATPIEGMPELYQYMQAQMIQDVAEAGADASTDTDAETHVLPPFFYLSASPYNLYPFLHGFRKQYYPPGALELRDTTLTSVAGLLKTLTNGTQAYKVGRMHKIHGWLPRKTFICIGDTTQSDPEAYGEIYRTFPGWVKLILIRKVTDIAALGIAEKNEPQRFAKAFEGVPPSAWHVFESPAECYSLVQQAIASGTTADKPQTGQTVQADQDVQAVQTELTKLTVQNRVVQADETGQEVQTVETVQTTQTVKITTQTIQPVVQEQPEPEES